LLENVHPNTLALIAAFFVAVARVLYQKALGRLNPTFITALVNAVSLVFALFLYWMSGGVDRWPVQGILWFVSVGLIGSLFGRYMSFVAQRLVGVSRTAVVMQSVLVWSTALRPGVDSIGSRRDGDRKFVRRHRDGRGPLVFERRVVPHPGQGKYPDRFGGGGVQRRRGVLFLDGHSDGRSRSGGSGKLPLGAFYYSVFVALFPKTGKHHLASDGGGALSVVGAFAIIAGK
jgi:uncharacterized membrane protein